MKWEYTESELKDADQWISDCLIKVQKKRDNYIKKIKEEKQKIHKDMMWFDLFVDYVHDNNINIYNEACEYADKIQMES